MRFIRVRNGLRFWEMFDWKLRNDEVVEARHKDRRARIGDDVQDGSKHVIREAVVNLHLDKFDGSVSCDSLRGFDAHVASR